MPQPAGTIPQLRDRLAALSSGAGYRPAPARALRTHLPRGFGRVETRLGPAWLRREMLASPGSAPGPVYLDTETTGLAGGAGTLVFAVALARPAAGGLEVLQLFLSDPGGEPALLGLLAQELSGVGLLATFNGASFDLPLLGTRWVMARMPGEFPSPPHLDLLALTRSLMRHRLPDCALSEVERALLGVQRVGDLPSAQVPEAYLRHLRDGWSPTLEAALRHNRQDVVSLHHLHRRLTARLEGREAGLEAPDWLAIGRHLGRRGRRADALKALRAAAEMAAGDASGRAGLLIARALSQRRRFSSAESLLAWLEARLTDPTEVSIARAKLLEWRLGDLAGALGVVEGAARRARSAEHGQD
ncbi:MAG: ribonuclease H-like domain-containing protein, partial [Candidatus Dormibacterales bacterium]